MQKVSGKFNKPSSRKNKIISLILLFYCLFAIFFGDYIPIEFADTTLKILYYSIIYISLPVFITLSIIHVFNIKDFSVLVTIMTIISLPILLIIGFGNAMCGTTNEVVFKSRTDTELVVMRSNGCGAWDSEFPTYTIHKIVPMTPIFNFVTKFDTTNIDKTIWVKNIDK